MALLRELLEGLQRDRMHPGALLVRLVRPVDVEVAQAGDLRAALAGAALDVAVEEVLRVGVHVQRPFVHRVLGELAPGAVHRGRRGVDERHLLALAPVEERLGVGVVVLHHVLAVRLGRVGAGALVQDRLERAVEAAAREPRQELALVHVVLDAQLEEVPRVGALGEVVDREDLVHAGAVQRRDQARADEAGGPGDDGELAHVRLIPRPLSALLPLIFRTAPGA